MTRLTSSGIRRLKLRRPASTCATGTCSFAAASAAGERRVGVAIDEDDPVGPLLRENPLDADEHRGRLLAVRPDPTPK